MRLKSKKLGKYSDMVIKRQSEHLEMFAAAYLKSTNIEPENAELVQETKEDKIIWYFRKKCVTIAIQQKQHMVVMEYLTAI